MSAEDVIRRQKEALAVAISELETKENHRIKRLKAIKNKTEHKQLAERFDRERNMEREKVERLMNDLHMTEQRLQDDSYAGFVEQRKTIKTQSQSFKSPFNDNQILPDRFEGLHNRDEQLFYGGMAKRFDQLDRKFERKLSSKPFDMFQEQKKVREGIILIP
jgi:hypothetical protein